MELSNIASGTHRYAQVEARNIYFVVKQCNVFQEVRFGGARDMVIVMALLYSAWCTSQSQDATSYSATNCHHSQLSSRRLRQAWKIAASRLDLSYIAVTKVESGSLQS